MTDRDTARRERQGRRWPVHVQRLGVDTPDDIAGTLTPEERVALVWTLSARMWELTGRPLPTYKRAEIPVAIIRSR